MNQVDFPSILSRIPTPTMERKSMRYLAILLAVAVVGSSVTTHAQKESAVDWDAAYELLLETDPKVRDKVESGGATKEQIIAWMKKSKAGVKKSASSATVAKLADFHQKLDALVKSGKLTKRQAAELYETMAGSEQDSVKQETDWDEAYEQLLKKDPGVKAKVDSGDATKEQVIAWLKQNRGVAGRKAKPGGKGKGGGKNGVKRADGPVNFYAIVIGRLRSKDVELGELTMEVDHVSSIYSNRWIKDEIVGKTVNVTGISGPLLDKLLQIKRGKTFKFRAGEYDVKSKTLTGAQKFHVLEEAAPFKAEDYGVPPQDFRGFRGLLQGKIVEVGGYEILMTVEEIVSVAKESKAANVEVIKGKRIRVIGLYAHKDAYDGLHVGDRIRVRVSHTDPNDELNGLDVLEKVERK